MRLASTVALITGGTSGIGKATAVLFAEEGAKVGLTGRDAARGGAVAGVERAFGPIDILFNNAGVFFPRTVPETTEQEWDDTIDVSLKGAFLMSKEALPGMIARRHGVIIHNSSGWGVVGGDRGAAYCAANGGLVLLTKAMAIDHGKNGIRVNCVCPGDVETPMLPDDARQRGLSWEEYAKAASNRPLGRPERSPAPYCFSHRTSRPSWPAPRLWWMVAVRRTDFESRDRLCATHSPQIPLTWTTTFARA